MKVVAITRFGGPEVLRIEERPRPDPGPAEIRVRVHASSVNRADLLQRRGRYPAPAGFPQDVPGLEYAGEVESVGPHSMRWRPGDRVMGITGGGAHAEFICVPEDEALAVPANLSWEVAGATPEVFLTAFDALFAQAELEEGESVLVHAVGSGVGTAAVQLAAAAGHVVFGSSRTGEKLEGAVALGLTHPLDASSNWVAEIEALTSGGGVDVVVDLVGGRYVEEDLRVVAERGRIVVVGLVAGARAEIDLGSLLRKRARLIGTVLRSRSSAEKVALARDFEHRVLPLLSSGRVHPVIDRVYPFEEVVAAHRLLESNATFGKVALRW